ncbi:MULTISPECIES: hypothetical protein [unclassified Streptomyces]|uniref:hypothetical protein n=1 Tax=unclassified Streptomyces TaxID=2593676 RepID=UPI002E2AE128|nr:hypothetical protein [Streptomyces sp. NBC_00223]
MSGPLALVAPWHEGVNDTAADGGSGSLRLSPRPLRRVPSWAVGDPVADLGDDLIEQCGAASHPDEIAALLESEGLTEDRISARYGHPDLFSLAAELFVTVPRRFPEPEPAADPWRVDPWRCVLRGLTFALPAAAYVLGGRWSDGPEGPFGVTRAVAAWAMAALCGWGWNQGLAHRAHLLLLAQRPGAAARTLLRGAVAGAGLSTVAAAAVARPGLPSAIVFAAGQALYVASATVLLVLGRERALLYVLAPLTVAACCGAGGLPSGVVAAVLTATVAAAAATALSATLAAAPAGDAGLAARLRELWRGDAEGGSGALGASVAHGVGGLAVGVLVVTAALSGQFVGALTVSMGLAEWLLFRLRGRSLAALRRTPVGERPFVRPWRVLGGCLTGYAAALTGLAAVEAAAVPGAASWNPAHLGALLALGCALWLALLLQSCGRPWTGACVPAVASVTAVGLLAAHVAAPGTVLTLVCASAAAVLLAASLTVTARVTTHH